MNKPFSNNPLQDHGSGSTQNSNLHESVKNNQPSNVIFVNEAPEDKNWTAHINILNNYTDKSVLLRMIIAAIQSGPHYPKHMHQDLIEQYFEAVHKERWQLEAKIDENQMWLDIRLKAKTMMQSANPTDKPSFVEQANDLVIRETENRIKNLRRSYRE